MPRPRLSGGPGPGKFCLISRPGEAGNLRVHPLKDVTLFLTLLIQAMTFAPTLDKQQTFAILRPICSRLVDPALKGNLAAPLEELRVTLRELDGTSLESCWDYVLYPLILILDKSRAPGEASGVTHKAVQPKFPPRPVSLVACDAFSTFNNISRCLGSYTLAPRHSHASSGA